MAVAKPPRKNQRRKGADALFTDWKPLNPRGLPLDFRTVATLPMFTRASDGTWKFDPWSVDLGKIRWWRAPYFLPAFGAQEVALNRLLIEAQPAYSLLALQILDVADVRPPPWLQQVFAGAVTMLAQQACGSIDEAFGWSPPHAAALASARDRRTKSRAAHFFAISGVIQGRPLDNELFEEVGAKLGIGKDKARELAMLEQARAYGSTSLTSWRPSGDWAAEWRALLTNR